MSNYKQVRIAVADTEKMDLLVALLSEMGYEGFEESGEGLSAFIPSDFFDEKPLQVLLTEQGLVYSLDEIAPQNWNALWESGFEPVVVNGFVAIRAAFHAPATNVLHEIIITPKMSFGTGHHATTYMMVEQMARLDFAGKKVLDFGTGTGVLAILAEKMGAGAIVAIDNDEWSINNATENVLNNGCKRIAVQKSDVIPAGQTYDIILANINLNVIIDNFAAMVAACNAGADILLSGFLFEDVAVLKSLLQQNNFQNIGVFQRDNWLCMGAHFPLEA